MQAKYVRRLPAIGALSVILAGCVMPGTVAAPTPYPPGYIPTVIHMTAVSIDAITKTASPPTIAPSQTPTTIPPTAAPTDTPTPGPHVPLGAIQIKAPGPMSRVASPLQVLLVAVAGDTKRVEVDLFGEDGRLLGRSVKAVLGDPEGDPLSLKIPFEIRAAGEDGYLQVSTKDLSGRIRYLVTLRILLLSSGASQINPAGNAIYERVALADLPPEAAVSGGTIALDGEYMPSSRQPMIVQLITDDGKNLSLRVLTGAGSDWQPFKTTLPYNVDGPTPARIYFSQTDDTLNGPVYVYSQEITLNP